jgi:hypothetical protein
MKKYIKTVPQQVCEISTWERPCLQSPGG